MCTENSICCPHSCKLQNVAHQLSNLIFVCLSLSMSSSGKSGAVFSPLLGLPSDFQLHALPLYGSLRFEPQVCVLLQAALLASVFGEDSDDDLDSAHAASTSPQLQTQGIAR